MAEKSEAEIKEVGFIGLGKMGKPMARRLLKAGFSLNIWNRTKDKTADLGKQGAKVMNSPREVAASSEVTITMIFDDPALEAVAFGEDGILAGIRAPGILIEMSTVSPDISSRVASSASERGVSMLRAPVSGSTNWAETGTLTILVSGDRKAYEKCEKIFGVIGDKLFYVGTEEEARYLKMALNIMVTMSTQALAEAATFCQKAKLDWSKVMEVIIGSVAASPSVCAKTACLAKRDFTPTSTIRQMAKDTDLTLSAGKQLGAPLPSISLIRQFVSALQATGRSELDPLSLVLIMEDLAGIKW